MKIGILPLGTVDSSIVERIQENFNTVFQAECAVIKEAIFQLEQVFDEERQQYHSSTILAMIRRYATRNNTLDKFLGIVDVDIFVPQLSFVFGEAECPGRTALISLYRLRPEFYGRKSNMELLLERAAKESTHELGHTLGLQHCSDPFCVMHFSNSIFETDRKQSFLCKNCYPRSEAIINKSRRE